VRHGANYPQAWPFDAKQPCKRERLEKFKDGANDQIEKRKSIIQPQLELLKAFSPDLASFQLHYLLPLSPLVLKASGWRDQTPLPSDPPRKRPSSGTPVLSGYRPTVLRNRASRNPHKKKQ